MHPDCRESNLETCGQTSSFLAALVLASEVIAAHCAPSAGQRIETQLPAPPDPR